MQKSMENEQVDEIQEIDSRLVELYDLKEIYKKPTTIELIRAGLDKYPLARFENVSSSEILDKIDKDSRMKKIGDEIKKLKDKVDHLNKQPGRGLKILTPQQMLTKLPISLAQVQAGNNSQGLENEIKHLLNSLYG